MSLGGRPWCRGPTVTAPTVTTGTAPPAPTVTAGTDPTVAAGTAPTVTAGTAPTVMAGLDPAIYPHSSVRKRPGRARPHRGVDGHAGRNPPRTAQAPVGKKRMATAAHGLLFLRCSWGIAENMWRPKGPVNPRARKLSRDRLPGRLPAPRGMG